MLLAAAADDDEVDSRGRVTAKPKRFDEIMIRMLVVWIEYCAMEYEYVSENYACAIRIWNRKISRPTKQMISNVHTTDNESRCRY